MTGEEFKEQVESALGEVRPSLQADGGDVELADYRDGIAFLRLTGACNGCPHSTTTIKNYLEKNLLERIPRLRGVQQV